MPAQADGRCSMRTDWLSHLDGAKNRHAVWRHAPSPFGYRALQSLVREDLLVDRLPGLGGYGLGAKRSDADTQRIRCNLGLDTSAASGQNFAIQVTDMDASNEELRSSSIDVRRHSNASTARQAVLGDTTPSPSSYTDPPRPDRNPCLPEVSVGSPKWSYHTNPMDAGPRSVRRSGSRGRRGRVGHRRC